MSTIRKNQIEMLVKKNSVTEMKIKRPISKFDTAIERIMELENRSIEIS